MKSANLLNAQRAYIDRVCRELSLDYTGLARRAGLSSTTITRPMNDAAWPNSLSKRTLRAVADFSRIPVPNEAWPIGGNDRIDQPNGGITHRIGKNDKGDLEIVLPARSSLPHEKVTALVQLFAAAPHELRDSILLQLKHPGLTGGRGLTSPLSIEEVETAIEEVMNEVTLDRIIRIRLLEALLLRLRSLSAPHPPSTTSDDAQLRRPRSPARPIRRSAAKQRA